MSCRGYNEQQIVVEIIVGKEILLQACAKTNLYKLRIEILEIYVKSILKLLEVYISICMINKYR